MRTLATVVAAVALCGAGAAAAAGPEASGAALWKHLSGEGYAQSWKMWPGKAALYQGTEPHGALLTTYVNSSALQAIEGKQGTMPVGAIVVKENYMPDAKLAAITAMYKVKGYNPTAGDWFWVKYGPDGVVLAEGKVEGCLKCHGANAANDYLFTGSLR